jgi:hypothetical protein
MPKYTFECDCNLRFVRTLKIGQHISHVCPDCGQEALRVWEGFAFEFSRDGKSPANSGVSKHDYPTADIAVGVDAEARWSLNREREKVKDKVRKEGGHRALIRRHVGKEIEYASGSDILIAHRKKIWGEVLKLESEKK